MCNMDKCVGCMYSSYVVECHHKIVLHITVLLNGTQFQPPQEMLLINTTTTATVHIILIQQQLSFLAGVAKLISSIQQILYYQCLETTLTSATLDTDVISSTHYRVSIMYEYYEPFSDVGIVQCGLLFV